MVRERRKFLFCRRESSAKPALRGDSACLYCAREITRSGLMKARVRQPILYEGVWGRHG